jgi:hypothetical protein
MPLRLGPVAGAESVRSDIIDAIFVLGTTSGPTVEIDQPWSLRAQISSDFV